MALKLERNRQLLLSSFAVCAMPFFSTFHVHEKTSLYKLVIDVCTSKYCERSLIFSPFDAYIISIDIK